MLKQIFITLSFVFFGNFGLQAQAQAQAQGQDPVLFSVEGNPVQLSEFKYIYTKTNGDNADFSKKSLDEYLNLYVKFKLKVQRAKDMKLDTIPALQQELEGYRRQLANSYLVDKEVTEALVKEAYERSLKDVDVSHIMVAIKPNPTPADTLAAYQKIAAIKKELDGGADFAQLAKNKSDDRSAKTNGGNIGFLTALLPNGFYPFESAAYQTPVGKISNIVRTSAGYHLVKVNAVREARGEIEAAHILIRKDAKDKGTSAKAKIDSIYAIIKKGETFEAMARTLSEDKLSSQKGGNVGYFGINKYERSFENAAFGLKANGDISQPIETSIGWHILKRLNKRETETFDVARRKLQPKIQRDSRYELAKASMVRRIQREANFTANKELLKTFSEKTGETFLSHKWKPSGLSKEVLFSLNNNVKYTLTDFEAFCQKNSRDRIRMNGKNTVEEAVRTLYDKFVAESCMQFEEGQLEKKYPEFKSLMREYEEGILLFEATKILVWDKASQDTVGLKAFHEQNKGNRKYMWDERAKVSFYALNKNAVSLLPKVRKYVKKRSPEKALKKFNKNGEVLTYRTEVIEKGKNKILDKMVWKAGMLSATEVNKKDNSQNFLKIEKIIPPTEKSLKEARGYVVADYQDHLEREWVKELKDTYKVEINNEVFESLIR